MNTDPTLIDSEKKLAAETAVARIQAGTVVGLGSGTTAAFAVKALGQRVRDGLSIVAVATSEATKALAIAEGIPMITTAVPLSIDLTIDGADEFDPKLRLTKGGGGDLLHEKIVASASRYEIIICDHTKRVEVLGRFPLAVEVIQGAWPVVAKAVRKLGGTPTLRLRYQEGSFGADSSSRSAPPREASGPFITDEGNYILDCAFGTIPDPAALAARLDVIPGLVEHGLFLGYASEVIMAVGREVRTFKS